jgi:chromosome segregation ATPase
MQVFSHRNSTLIIALLLISGFVSASWKVGKVDGNKGYFQQKDTSPQNKKGGNYDLDYHLQQVEKALNQLEQQLRHTDWQQVQKDIQEGLSKIDMEKMNLQVEEAMKKVDFEKIKQETQAAIQKIDFEKMKEEMNAAMRESKEKVDWEKVSKEMKEAMEEAKKSMDALKRIDTEQLKKEMAKVKADLQKEKSNFDREMQKIKQELSKEKLDIDKSIQDAKIELTKVKEELTGYKTMISEMEKDGLLNSKNDYTIEYRNRELYINNTRQSQQVTDKYKIYIKKEKLTIKNKSGSIEFED